MALLNAASSPEINRSSHWYAGGLLVLILLFPTEAEAAGQSAPSREYQVKAAFLFNFTQFVEWPPDTFPTPESPLTIGILGDDPFGAVLDDTIQGEKSGTHPLAVRRYHTIAEAGGCQILFISQSEIARLEQIFSDLRGRSILTVGDCDSFAQRGGMIRFVTVNKKIRLRVNLVAAQDANLIISSKLLRPAEIVATGKIDP